MRKSERNSYRFWSSASRKPVMRSATPGDPTMLVPGSAAFSLIVIALLGGLVVDALAW
jgi:hypothetical protein